MDNEISMNDIPCLITIFRTLPFPRYNFDEIVNYMEKKNLLHRITLCLQMVL